MLLLELKDLSSDEIGALRRQLLKNLKDFCKQAFEKPVDINSKNEHIYAKHHTNDQIEFDLWIHPDFIFLDNFYLDDSLKNNGLGTRFVETLVATLPNAMTIKVRDHRGPETDMVSMSDTFWAKMKAKHDDHKWIITH
jgi:hypothetical protein